MACVDAGACSHNPDHRVLTLSGYIALGPTHPVLNVSYQDVQEYLAWLNSKVGDDVYRLPTEAEWEYAARAGAETPFAQGEELSADQANFSRAATENLLLNKVKLRHLKNRRRPVPVDELDAANAWGLRHMAGNVREITLSCWAQEHIGLSSSAAYLSNARSQDSCRRVAKGGAFSTAMDVLRHAARHGRKEISKSDNLGFRVARELRASGK